LALAIAAFGLPFAGLALAFADFVPDVFLGAFDFATGETSEG